MKGLYRRTFPQKAIYKLLIRLFCSNHLKSNKYVDKGDMNTLLQQLKKRRLDLDLKQNDMMLRIGVSRQQYQRLESRGNPRLDTLELIAKGLNSETQATYIQRTIS